MKREGRHAGLAGVLLVAGLIAALNYGVGPALCGHIVSNGCSGVNNDTSRWLSVMRGPDLQPGGKEVYQYWLSQRYAYATNAQAQVFSVSTWTLPTDLSPIDGLVLSLYPSFNGQRQVLRVLLQDAKNCFYDVLVPQDSPSEYVTQRSFCSTTVFRKIVPDSNVDMRDVRNLLLVSFDKIVVFSVDNLQQVGFAKIPEGNLSVTLLVDASYQRSHGYDDQLFIVRGANTTGQLAPSEIINYRVNATQQEVTLTFGHFTYLQGESDTMFLNDASHLFWTQVVINEDWGVKQGMLFDYSLQYPHAFRYGAIPFGPQPSARWGAHAFSSLSKVNAMMITYTNSHPSEPGFTVQAVYLNESLSSLQFVDMLVVNSSGLPSLGQSIGVTALAPDFAVVMATTSTQGQLCLELFLHCPNGSAEDCFF